MRQKKWGVIVVVFGCLLEDQEFPINLEQHQAPASVLLNKFLEAPILSQRQVHQAEALEKLAQQLKVVQQDNDFHEPPSAVQMNRRPPRPHAPPEATKLDRLLDPHRLGTQDGLSGLLEVIQLNGR